MLEVAWLGRLEREWLLVTGNDAQDVRRWTDRELALKDLAEEGWTITRPHRRDMLADPIARMILPGYCLRRTVH